MNIKKLDKTKPKNLPLALWKCVGCVLKGSERAWKRVGRQCIWLNSDIRARFEPDTTRPDVFDHYLIEIRQLMQPRAAALRRS